MAIHPAAIVEDGAVIGNDVSIGAFSYIGKNVVIGDGTNIDNHVSVVGHTTLGQENHLFPYASVGAAPQDVSFCEGQETKLQIGDNNVIREFVTINSGTAKEPTCTTVIGSKCMFMAYSHVAHDCVIGDGVLLSNTSMLGGHVRMGNYSILSGFVGVHHFTSVGAYAFVAGLSSVRQDVAPYMISEGTPLEVRNLNYVALRRGGFSDELIAELKKVYKALYRSDLMLSAAIRKYESDCDTMFDEVKNLLQFLRNKVNGPNGRYLEGVLRK